MSLIEELLTTIYYNPKINITQLKNTHSKDYSTIQKHCKKLETNDYIFSTKTTNHKGRKMIITTKGLAFMTFSKLAERNQNKT